MGDMEKTENITEYGWKICAVLQNGKIPLDKRGLAGVNYKRRQ
jgi:hypothetical protein